MCPCLRVGAVFSAVVVAEGFGMAGIGVKGDVGGSSSLVATPTAAGRADSVGDRLSLVVPIISDLGDDVVVMCAAGINAFCESMLMDHGVFRLVAVDLIGRGFEVWMRRKIRVKARICGEAWKRRRIRVLIWMLRGATDALVVCSGLEGVEPRFSTQAMG